MIPRWKYILIGLLSLVLATAIWLPCVHFFFNSDVVSFFDQEKIPARAQQLAHRHLELWRDTTLRHRELDRMRHTNAEWDFMGRTFFVWSLAEMALRDPQSKSTYLPVIDQIIDETLRLEAEKGMLFFLMPYATARSFVVQPPRSLFLDSEIALMLAVRRVVEEKPDYQPQLQQRVQVMLARLQKNNAPIFAESYPDECWTFDHAVALAAIKLSDHLDHTDHSAFIRDWLIMAKKRLIHPATGLLVSSFTTDGRHLDGPEGSSIWLVSHCLRLVDEPFAREQYEKARKELACHVLGFGYSREWPRAWKGPQDVDSGVVIPVLEASAGSSGLAFIGASSFSDLEYLSELHRTLDLAAFPIKEKGQLRYCASNPVGDAAILYSMVLGPLWQKVKTGKP